MKKLLLFTIIAAAAGIIFYFFYWSPVYRIKPLNLVPTNAAYILASGEPLKSWETIGDSKIWQHLKQNPQFEKITRNADHLDSLFLANEWLDFVGNKELLIAAVPVQDTYDYLYIMDLARISYLKDIQFYLQDLLDENFRITHRSFSGIDITALYNITKKETLYLSFIENLIIASKTPAITEAAILQYANQPEKDIYFLEITDQVGYQGLLRAYVNFKAFMPYLDQFASDATPLNVLKHSLRYAGLTLAVEDNTMAFNGYMNINDTVNSYLRALYEAGKGGHDFLKVVPEQSPFFISLGFKNFPTFIENLEKALDNNPKKKEAYLKNRDLMEKFLKIDLKETFVSWVDDEVVMLQTSPKSKMGVDAYAILLKTKDPDAAQDGLNRIREQITKRTPVKIKSVDYKSHTIHYMAVKGFFKVFLGNLFNKFDKPYYSIVGEWVVFSNHPRTIKNIIDAIDKESTLFFDQGFQAHYNTLNQHSAVYAYVNIPEIFNDLQPMMEPEEWLAMKANDEYIKCFSRLSFQLSPIQHGVFETRVHAQYKSPERIAPQLLPIPNPVSVKNIPEQTDPWNKRYEQVLNELDKITIPDLSQNNYKTYHENGTLHYDISLKNGWKHGRFSSYFRNGNEQFRGRYKDDRKDGLWRVYDEDGDLLVKLRYADGVLVE